MASLNLTCTPDTTLELSAVTGSWGWNVIQVLGSTIGPSLGGFVTGDASVQVPLGTTACSTAGFVPVYVMAWLPEGQDSVAWYTTLITRSFDYLGISGPNPMSVGIIRSPVLSEFNTEVHDGLSRPPASATRGKSTPEGTLAEFCLSPGVYSVTVTQLEATKRLGAFFVADAQGCSQFPNTPALSISGGLTDRGYFAIGTSAQIATSCIKTIESSAATAGWNGCSARGGTRVLSTFVGTSVYHSVRRLCGAAPTSSPPCAGAFVL